jgi:RecA/RadA recombinase
MFGIVRLMLRAQLEAALGERIHSPFTDLEKRVWERIPSGIPSLDKSTGGLPRGAITEVFGGVSSGKTSIALSILAAAGSRGEICALVDGTDTFDPATAESCGMDLRRLLWVRCKNLDQALRSTDLLLQGGGFGLVAADLSGLPPKDIRSVPLARWFRFQRAIEDTPTLLLLIGQDSIAKSAAALVLNIRMKQTEWAGAPQSPSHATLLSAGHLDIEVLRSRRSSNPNSEIRNPKFAHHVRLHSRP